LTHELAAQNVLDSFRFAETDGRTNTEVLGSKSSVKGWKDFAIQWLASSDLKADHEELHRVLRILRSHGVNPRLMGKYSEILGKKAGERPDVEEVITDQILQEILDAIAGAGPQAEEEQDAGAPAR
jgi:hypothetical protein